jgi:PAS domain S-box-containing protein
MDSDAHRQSEQSVETGNLVALIGGHAHEREEFYRFFMESLEEGVIITDHESRILYVNSRFESLFGFPRSELIGAISYELLRPREEWPRMRRRLNERLAGKEENYEFEHISKDGQRHWISVRALPYRNGRNEVVGTIGLNSSIRERKHLNSKTNIFTKSYAGTTAQFSATAPSCRKSWLKLRWSRRPMRACWFSASRALARNWWLAQFTIAACGRMRRLFA